jgi:hypothetical protein
LLLGSVAYGEVRPIITVPGQNANGENAAKVTVRAQRSELIL